MKKFLLFFASLFMTTLAALAQWTLPVPAHVSEFSYSTMAAEGGDTIVYYIYNKDAAAFLTEGNDWGTQASIGSTGLKFAISKYIANDEDGNPLEWDGKSLIFNDYCAVKSAWKEMFLASADGIYMDRNGHANYLWEVDAMGDGIYRIAVAEANPTINQTAIGGDTRLYFGYDSNAKSAESTVLSCKIDPADDTEAAIDWYFVDEEGYAAYSLDLARYNAAAELLAAIEKAADYSSVDASAAQAVYDNTSSTLEELTAATDALSMSIAEAAFENATEDNPYDASSWLKNPTFDTNADGWDNTFVVGESATECGWGGNASNNSLKNDEDGAFITNYMQAWAASGAKFNPNVDQRALGIGQLSQTLASMPEGKYKFTVDAIACYEPTAKAEDVHGVELFAVGGTVDVKQDIATVRKPSRFSITFINTGGAITMGVRTTEECTATWVVLDNFSLTYYGKTEEDPYKVTLNQLIASSLSKYPLEDLDDMIASADAKEAYKTAIAEGEAATSDYDTYVDNLKAAVSGLADSKDAYVAYNEELEVVRDYLLNNDVEGDLWDKVVDYVEEGNELEPDETYPNGSADYILGQLTLTTEQITAETEFLKEMFNNAKFGSIKAGDEITKYLENPNFDEAMSGWEYDHNYSNADGKMDYTADPLPIADGWYCNFNVYQTLTGVPNGLYKLEVQAFYREVQNSTSSYVNYTADPENYVSPAYIYANNSEKSVLSIASTTFSEGEYDGGFESVADGVYLPSNNRGVYAVFNAGLYNNTVYGIVSDGTLTVGIKNLTDTGAGRWVAFDNFRVTYIGDDPDIYAQLTSEQVEALKKAIEANKDNLTNPVLNAANEVVASAGTITDAEAAAALLTQVSEATAAIQANAASYKEYVSKQTKLVSTLAAVGADASIAAEFPSDISALETAEIDTLIAHMDVILADIPSAAGFVLQEGIIENATFDTSVDGWEVEYIAGQTATDVGFQTTNISNGEVVLNQVLQAWSDVDDMGALGDASAYQIISGLPAGEYLLVVDANVSDQSDEPKEIVGAYLFAQEGENEAQTIAMGTEDYVPETFYLRFTKTSDDSDVKIGFYTQETTANWIAVDNFRIYVADATAIKAVDADEAIAADASAIYTAAGVRTSSLQKGINIVKMTNGKVQKVLVK